jgi:hypothetical protein
VAVPQGASVLWEPKRFMKSSSEGRVGRRACCLALPAGEGEQGGRTGAEEEAEERGVLPLRALIALYMSSSGMNQW